jgi:NADPH2:quinone reductase
MRAVGYHRSLPIDDADALIDLEIDRPAPSGRDLLVKVEAVSVNPVDAKTRARAAPEPGRVKILGWDAAGVVAEIGADCSLFRPGDKVWYAGSYLRQGANSEFHLVDERLVGRMPDLAFGDAAALPLTMITAWELLFDRFALPRGAQKAPGAILIIGGAGGVGSALIQLARALTDLTVIATASRAQSRAWCLGLGAHHVVNHGQPLAPQLAALGRPEVEYVASLTGTARNLAQFPEMLAPQGKFGLIDDPPTLDAVPFKRKSVSIHWEAMFTRSTFATADMIAQHRMLNEVAALVESGRVRTTVALRLGSINAANLRNAHAQIETGRTIGKITLAGF